MMVKKIRKKEKSNPIKRVYDLVKSVTIKMAS